jgi:hypothetical protein
VPLAAAQSACESQPHESVAGSHLEPPGLPAHGVHVPDAPHAVSWFPATHELPEQQNPPLQLPLVAPPHAAVHDPPAHVGVPPAHGEQPIPFAPHAAFSVPGLHVPALQQPPLHGVCVPPPHALPHVCALVSQASPEPPPVAAGQSAAASHPHVSVLASHFEPIALPTQLAHAPAPPHAVLCVPLTQAPVEQQNPPEHTPSFTAPHADVHTPEAHVGVPPPHGAHAPPLAPQAAFWVPATQVPALLQHPPLHACVASHLLWQRCEAVSHDSRAGQSFTVVQPHDEPLSHR